MIHKRCTISRRSVTYERTYEHSVAACLLVSRETVFILAWSRARTSFAIVNHHQLARESSSIIRDRTRERRFRSRGARASPRKSRRNSRVRIPPILIRAGMHMPAIATRVLRYVRFWPGNYETHHSCLLSMLISGHQLFFFSPSRSSKTNSLCVSRLE